MDKTRDVHLGAAKEMAKKQSKTASKKSKVTDGKASNEKRKAVLNMMAKKHSTPPKGQVSRENLAKLNLQADVMRTMRDDSGLTFKSAVKESMHTVESSKMANLEDITNKLPLSPTVATKPSACSDEQECAEVPTIEQAGNRAQATESVQSLTDDRRILPCAQSHDCAHEPNEDGLKVMDTLKNDDVTVNGESDMLQDGTVSEAVTKPSAEYAAKPVDATSDKEDPTIHEDVQNDPMADPTDGEELDNKNTKMDDATSGATDLVDASKGAEEQSRRASVEGMPRASGAEGEVSDEQPDLLDDVVFEDALASAVRRSSGSGNELDATEPRKVQKALSLLDKITVLKGKIITPTKSRRPQKVVELENLLESTIVDVEETIADNEGQGDDNTPVENATTAAPMVDDADVNPKQATERESEGMVTSPEVAPNPVTAVDPPSVPPSSAATPSTVATLPTEANSTPTSNGAVLGSKPNATSTCSPSAPAIAKSTPTNSPPILDSDSFAVPAPRPPTNHSGSQGSMPNTNTGIRTFSRKPSVAVQPTSTPELIPSEDAMDMDTMQMFNAAVSTTPPSTDTSAASGGARSISPNLPLTPLADSAEEVNDNAAHDSQTYKKQSQTSDSAIVSQPVDNSQTSQQQSQNSEHELELELGLAVEPTCDNQPSEKPCKLRRVADARREKEAKETKKKARPSSPRPPMDLDDIEGLHELEGEIVESEDDEDEEDEEDEDDDDVEKEETLDDEVEGVPAVQPLTAEEQEGIQNSQMMTLRWEMSQSQFEEAESLGQSQYSFDDDDNDNAESSQAIFPVLSQMSQSSNQSFNGSLKRKASFRSLSQGEGLGKEKLDLIKRQNSYTNTTCNNVVYSEEPTSNGSGASVAGPRHRVKPVRVSPGGGGGGSLFEALCSAPNKVKDDTRKRPADGNGDTAKRVKV
jgi:hypothetical protein